MEVYLDNSATTRAYDCVRDIVCRTMCEDYGNPSSMHTKGVESEKYIREAKERSAPRRWCAAKRDSCPSYESTGKGTIFYIRWNGK